MTYQRGAVFKQKIEKTQKQNKTNPNKQNINPVFCALTVNTVKHHFDKKNVIISIVIYLHSHKVGGSM